MKDQQLLVFFLSFNMEKNNPAIQHFLSCIDLEDQEQAKRFQLNETHSLKALKAERNYCFRQEFLKYIMVMNLRVL